MTTETLGHSAVEDAAVDNSTVDAVDTASDALVAKVRKMMAMAEATTNPNEAETFSRKAAELIATHRIAPERLAKADPAKLAVKEYEIGRGAYVRGRLALLQAVAEAHGCMVAFQARERGTVALVAGFRDDLATVEVMYNSLHAQAGERMAAERRRTASATQQWRRSFLFGYATEIRDMLAAAERTAHKAAAESGNDPDSFLPALQARDEQVDTFAQTAFGRTRKARQPAPANVVGFRAGRTAASKADLGRKRVGGRRAIGRGMFGRGK